MQPLKTRKQLYFAYMFWPLEHLIVFRLIINIMNIKECVHHGGTAVKPRVKGLDDTLQREICQRRAKISQLKSQKDLMAV